MKQFQSASVAMGPKSPRVVDGILVSQILIQSSGRCTCNVKLQRFRVLQLVLVLYYPKSRVSKRIRSNFKVDQGGTLDSSQLRSGLKNE